MIKGTDLSHWNDNVDYVKMAASGIRFACLKLGQGRLGKDHMFDTHAANCTKVGVPWDEYWFCDYRDSGYVNVTQLVKVANGNYGMGHVVQDLEFYDGFGPRPSGKHMLIFCLDFFRALKDQTGINGYLYINRDVINQMWAAATPTQKSELLSHPLWIASDTMFPKSYPWEEATLNQYELDIAVSWARGTVDLDDFMGTEEEFLVWKSGQTPPPLPPPLTHEQEHDILWREAKAHGWNLNP